MVFGTLFRRKMITTVNGCITTGKEANVYFAHADTKELVIKVFKPSITSFKKRDKNGALAINEYRNLSRLQYARR